MNNIVLKSLLAENFASFADRVVFTTEVDASKKEYPENIFPMGDDFFNRVTFIYGANGSGKTFFCKILREIQRLLDWSPIMAVNNAQLLSQFKGMDTIVPTFVYDVSYQDKPTSLGIDLVIDEITYHYEFSIQNKKIISELLTKKYRRTEKLLERTSSSFKDISLRSELKSFEDNLRVVKEEALCLPMAAFLNNSLASILVEAIRSINVLNMTAARLAPTNSQESFSEERISKYIQVLQKADPTLRKLNVSVEEEETTRQRIDSDDFENREIIATKTTLAIQAEHAVYDQNKETSRASIDFFHDESLGTVKLFSVLPHLFDVLEDGGALIVDEIENGLHLSIVKDIIRLFIDPKSNPYCAQLICTSHQPLLVSGNIRRDQVWVACKDNYGKSSLRRMSKMSTSRAKVNITNRLLDGAFGCNPEPFFGDPQEG